MTDATERPDIGCARRHAQEEPGGTANDVLEGAPGNRCDANPGRATWIQHYVLAVRGQPAAPWMENIALEVWIDVEHTPILVRLSGTLDQFTAINVVPVVKELMAEGRDVELHTFSLEVPDAGGIEALAELQRLVQHSGERFIRAETLLELSVSDRSL